MSLVSLRQYVSDLIHWKDSEIRFEYLLTSCKYKSLEKQMLMVASSNFCSM